MNRETHGFTDEMLELYRKVFPEQNASAEQLEYFAWPELFCSTSGPYGGIGGAVMTTFTVEAFYNGVYGTTLYVCLSTYQKGTTKFEPFKVLSSVWTRFT
jgi:hypothetical protein